jgi:hypothetical protein
MSNLHMSIRLFFDHWPQYHQRLVDVVAEMSTDELALRTDPTRDPMGHRRPHCRGAGLLVVRGARCDGGGDDLVTHPHGDGWEDDEDSPRGVADLVTALESTWRIVERCLDGWTLEMLGDMFERTKMGSPKCARGSRSCKDSSATMPITAASCHRPSGSPGFRQVDLWGPRGKVSEPGQYG